MKIEIVENSDQNVKAIWVEGEVHLTDFYGVVFSINHPVKISKTTFKNLKEVKDWAIKNKFDWQELYAGDEIRLTLE